MDFETKRVKLDKGDTLYLYTDGVTEAMDPESAQYEDVRLKSYLGSARKLSIRELIQGNIQDLKKHTRGANQSDDITLLALRYLGAA
jgi:sigma-B regulation protein RsbU (phosphoserine phosphatase)